MKLVLSHGYEMRTRVIFISDWMGLHLVTSSRWCLVPSAGWHLALAGLERTKIANIDEK